MRWKRLSNWAKAMIVLGLMVLAMAIPITRKILLLILPLGSGIDDLIFFVLLFLFGTVALIKLSDVEAVLDKLRRWFAR